MLDLDTSLRAWRCGALVVLVAAACGPGAVDASATDAATTDAGSTGAGSTGATGAEAPTTGEPPAVDCAAVPAVLDAPAWVGEPEAPGNQVAAAADGEVLFLDTGNRVLRRFGAGGVGWSHAFAEDEGPAAVAGLPDGRVVVGGAVYGASTWEGRLWLLGADGARLAEATIDREPGRSESVVAMGVSPTGEVAAAVFTVPNDDINDSRLRIDRHDDELGWAWSVDAGAYAFAPALDVDAAGDVHVATADIVGTSNGGFGYTWALRVRSFDAAGERWAAEPVEVETDNNVLALAVGAGDQVYVLGQRPSGFVVQALTLDGAPVWTWTRDAGDPPSEDWLAGHRLGALAASPCGGVYLGGYSDVDIDGVAGAGSLFHVAADGTPGTIVHLLERPHDGTFEHGDVAALDVTLGRIVAVGALRPVFPNDASDRTWARSF